MMGTSVNSKACCRKGSGAACGEGWAAVVQVRAFVILVQREGHKVNPDVTRKKFPGGEAGER